MKVSMTAICVCLVFLPRLGRAQLANERVIELQREAQAIHSRAGFVDLAKKITMTALTEDDLIRVFRKTTGRNLAITDQIISSIAILNIPAAIPAPNRRSWDDHFLDREELRARVMQLIVALYARLFVNDQPEAVKTQWKYIIGFDMDAILLTIERGYADPGQKLVTTGYLHSILEPIVQTVLNAYVLSPLYPGAQEKLRIFKDAMDLSVNHMFKMRLGIIRPYVSENGIELVTNLLNPLDYISIGVRTVLSIVDSRKLHFKSERAPFQQGEQIEVNTYPRLTEYTLKNIFKKIDCEKLLAVTDD